jgi:hypothetical protein
MACAKLGFSATHTTRRIPRTFAAHRAPRTALCRAPRADADADADDPTPTTRRRRPDPARALARSIPLIDRACV